MCKVKKNGHKKVRKTFSGGLSFNEFTGASIPKPSIIKEKKPEAKIQTVKRI